MIKIDGYRYKADEGCFIVRKIDDFVMGENICLGDNDSSENYYDKKYSQEEYEEFYNPNLNTLENKIKEKIFNIQQYDLSSNVNVFKINGKESWLDKATRVGLVNSANTQVQLGKDVMTLWLNYDSYTLDPKIVLNLLLVLEDYALQCYNVTSQHIVNVSKLNRIEDVESYDYTIGYPEVIEINV